MLRLRVLSLVMLSVVFATSLFVPAASADPATQVRWSDVIGIVQAGAVIGTGTGAVTGGGVPWATLGGQAAVNLTTGTANFKVRGLVLALGNSIGTRAAIASVKGTLVCDTDGSATGNSVLVDTDAVPLSAQGDAVFTGKLTIPGECLSETDVAFLVRIVGGAADGRWIAAGIVRRP
jgi:hypothetical protein